MPRYEVAASEGRTLEVQAATWLHALGEGLRAMDLLDAIDRLACEVLPNGRVLARDVRSGQGYAVLPLDPIPTAAPSDRRPHAELLSLDGSEELGEEHDGEDHDGEEEGVEDGPTGLHGHAPGMEAPSGIWPLAESETAETSTSTALVIAFLDRILGAPSRLMAWHEALDAAQALVPSEAGAALELEAEGRLRFLHAYGPHSRGVQGAVMPADTGIAGFAVRRVASLLVTDTRADPRFCSDFDEVTGFQTRAVICVPVALEGRVYGCLELLNPLGPRAFDRAQVEVVELLAGGLAERLASL